MLLTTLLICIGLALVHLFAGKLRFLEGVPRSAWLSFAGGVSVAYVFIHVLPELKEAQETIRGAGRPFTGFFEHHAYLVALAGLAAFYGLERLVSRSLPDGDGSGEASSPAGNGIFWLHIASFTVYNMLIGYLLLHREEDDPRGLVFFAVAMAFHFLVNDHGLRDDHRRRYDRVGRWILSAAVFVGWAAGLLTNVGEKLLAVLFAFLAGSVILNVLKEELPEERKSRFWAFALGASAYTLLLLLI